jgi:hypothetical protein
MKYRFCLLVVGTLVLLFSGLVSAQDNGNRGRNNDPGVLPNGNLDPNYTQRFPSEGSTTINLGNGDVTTLASCNTITFYYTSSMFSIGGLNANATSYVRDSGDFNYPCDISRVGARVRLWVGGLSRGDSTMLYAYNSADKSVAVSSASHNCASANKLVRGNHEFRQGVSNFAYVTETTGCG